MLQMREWDHPGSGPCQADPGGSRALGLEPVWGSRYQAISTWGQGCSGSTTTMETVLLGPFLLSPEVQDNEQ